MENKKPTQCERIRKYLKDFGTITQLQALSDLGIMRLASRISEMRKDGEAIGDRIVEVKNRYGETCRVKQYYIENPSEGAFDFIANDSKINPVFATLFRK